DPTRAPCAAARPQRCRGDRQPDPGSRQPTENPQGRDGIARSPRLWLAPPRAHRATERRSNPQPHQALRPPGAARRGPHREGGLLVGARRARSAARHGTHRALGHGGRPSDAAQPGHSFLAGDGPVSYAAEPYVQFVEDLLVALTGGVTRETFVFHPEL